VECLNCGGPAVRHPKYKKHNKYCSKRCGNTYLARKSRAADHSDVACTECGKLVRKNNKRQHYCSKLCKDKAQDRRYGTAYATEKTLRSRGASLTRYLRSLLNHKQRKAHLTTEMLLELYASQSGLCALSGRPMTYILMQGRVATNISIDQIVAQGGYTPGNIRLVCKQANVMKFTETDEQLLAWCKDIIKTLEEIK